MISGPSRMGCPLNFGIFRGCLEHPTSNPRPWLWVLFALVIQATGSSADVLNLDSVNGGTESLEIAKDQIETGEYEEAIRVAESEIGRTEAIWGRYNIALVEPLVVLGDGLTGYGDYESALKAYDRALHVTRVNTGLHDPNQVAVVYREANAYYAKGDIAAANDRHEYAYHVLERNFDQQEDESALIPGTFVLANWYTKTYNIFMARTFFQKARVLAETHYDEGHPMIIEALRGIANTYLSLIHISEPTRPY